ncbi:RNA-guided endonuclease TnpB family protein [Dehalococcoidia bacterium]|nr:RNA-guided endonuclease TnpB family protein [Dehalococcoidia bacterium]
MLKVAVKAVKAKIVSPTRKKEKLLEAEYQGFQAVLHRQDAPIYSATRQQAERLRKRIKKPRHWHYPLIIRRDTLKVEKKDTKLCSYWARIPIGGIRGGIWAAIIPHCPFPEGCSIREAKLLKLKKGWFLYITIQREVEVKEVNGTILAVDLGEKHLATSVRFNGKMESPKFYGKEVRGIRRHYHWLRKRLEERKLLKVVKRIGRAERRKVDAILHKISRAIVEEAKVNDATIILGELKGIRKKAKGKRFNRIISNMPYYRFSSFIQYKALWEGIPVVKGELPHASHGASCFHDQPCGNWNKSP